MAHPMTTFRTTLRKLATEQNADERMRLSDVLASELEIAFNRQGNQAQLAVSDTEEVLLKKFDSLQKDVGDGNLLLSTFMTNFPAQLATFQTELRGAVAEETARGLGKLSGEIEALKGDTEALKQGQVTFTNRLEALDERHGGQWEEVRASVEHLTQRLTADEERLDKKRAELDGIHEENAAMREEIAAINEYIARNRRAELDDLKERVAQLEARLKRDA